MAGNQTYTNTISKNGCIAVYNTTVVVNALPNFGANAISLPPYCINNTLSVFNSGAPNLTYTWLGSNLEYFSNRFAANPNIFPTVAGVVSVSITGTNTITGCSNILDRGTYTIAGTPTITSIIPAVGVVGSVITLLGTEFNESNGLTSVSLAGPLLIAANVISNNVLTFTIPNGATSSNVTVTGVCGNAVSIVPLNVLQGSLYRSKNSGAWDISTNWEVSNDNGAIFTPSTTFPGATSAFDQVSITGGNSVTITGPVPFPIASLTVNGTLGISSATISVSGNIDLIGVEMQVQTTSTLYAQGAFNLKNASIFNANTGSFIYFQNGIDCNSTGSLSLDGNTYFTTNNQTISGTASSINANLTSILGIELTNNFSGSLNFLKSITGTNPTSTFVNNTTAYFLSEEEPMRVGNLISTSLGSALAYVSNNPQNIKSGDFNNINLQNTGFKTLLGDTKINTFGIFGPLDFGTNAAKSLTITSSMILGSTLSMGSAFAHVLDLKGNVSSVSGGLLSLTGSNTKVVYSSTDPLGQVLLGGNYQRVEISGGNRKTLTGGNLSISGVGSSSGWLDLFGARLFTDEYSVFVKDFNTNTSIGANNMIEFPETYNTNKFYIENSQNRIIQSYPVGTIGKYSPMNINTIAGVFSGRVGVRPFITTTGFADYNKRMYDVSVSGFAPTDVKVNFTSINTENIGTPVRTKHSNGGPLTTVVGSFYNLNTFGVSTTGNNLLSGIWALEGGIPIVATGLTVAGLGGLATITTIGGILPMVVSYFPTNASVPGALFSIVPSSIAGINSVTGIVTALGNGLATVIASVGTLTSTFVITITGQNRSISVNTLPSSICVGQLLTLSFNTSGTFTPGYTAYLYNNVSTVQFATNNSSPISGTIPSTLFGTGFRIKVISNTPNKDDLILPNTTDITIRKVDVSKNFTLSDSALCEGNGVKVVIQAAEAGVNYGVLLNGSTISVFGTGNGSDLTLTIPASNLSPNAYTIKVTGSACGNGTLTGTGSLLVNNQAITTNAIRTNFGGEICETNPFVFTIVGAQLGVQYSYLLPSNNLGSINLVGANQDLEFVLPVGEIPSNINPQNLTLFASAIGCPQVQLVSPATAIVRPQATINGINPEALRICSGQLFNLTLSSNITNAVFDIAPIVPFGNVSGEPNIGNSFSTTQINRTLSGAGVLDYNISVTPPSPPYTVFCGSFKTFSVTVTSAPSTNVLVIGDTVCVGIGIISLRNVDYNITYQAIGSDGNPLGESNVLLPSTIDKDLKLTIPGTAFSTQGMYEYAVEAIGCTTLELQNKARILVLQTAGGPTIVQNKTPNTGCDKTNLTLSVSGFYTRLHWKYGNSYIAGATSSTFKPVLNGSYSADIQAGRGCNAIAGPVLINLNNNNPKPTIRNLVQEPK